MVSTIILFVIILGVLVFVHELGHFLVARRNGITAEEFGFGFPPRLAGFVQDEKTNRLKFVWGNKDIKSKNTIYSINWIPLGGFVKIKGEDGESKEQDSFASKSAWKRIKVLAAGVIMNFILAWFLISIILMVGAPEAIDANDISHPAAKIQITEILPNSPASEMGLQIGDEILKNQAQAKFSNVADVQDYINNNKGQQIVLEIRRGNQIMKLNGSPRADAPQGQGPLGIGLAQTVITRYPWYAAIWNGLKETLNLIIAILIAFYGILKNLFMGHSVGAEVTGPIGIAVLTKQVATLGFVYILQFAALLSVNLGIINALPFPALDGGRILFVLIEKVKGSPVSQRTEQLFHTIGFMLLIMLMIFVTFRDVMKFIR